MAENGEAALAEEDLAGSWKERTLQRSLKNARVKAISKGDRYISIAKEMIRESGRGDFTIQELADRARTSLRSFYQYFSSRDDLLLAILEETVKESVDAWRAETDGMDPLDAIEVVLGKLYGGEDVADSWMGVNQALASYHIRLAETYAAPYHRAVSPIVDLLDEHVRRGVDAGTIRADVPAEQTVRLTFQMIMGAGLVSTLSVPPKGRDADFTALWALYRQGLEALPAPAGRTVAAPRSPRRGRASR